MQELDLPEVFLEGGVPRYPSSASCSLREMTLEILSRNDEWFFLFIPLSHLLGLVVQQIYSRQITRVQGRDENPLPRGNSRGSRRLNTVTDGFVKYRP